jgi:hypothetical protein
MAIAFGRRGRDHAASTVRANPLHHLNRSTHMRIVVLLILLSAGMPIAVADDSALQRCRTMAEDAARLACYDAIVDSGAPAAVVVEKPEQFGLPDSARVTPIDTIESTIEGDFRGWGPNERIRLANGQVWEIADGSRGVISGGASKVTIKRGTFGTFFMDFEGRNKSPRVRRVR